MSTPRLPDEWIPFFINGGKKFLVAKYPIRNEEYFEFINRPEILEDELRFFKKGEYKRINIFNYDSHFSLYNNEIVLDSEKTNHPVTNISYFAAEEYARQKGCQLMNKNLWLALLGVDLDFYMYEYSQNNLNIKDRLGGIQSVFDGLKGESGLVDLIGNVRCWGEKASDVTAYCYGLSFNKVQTQVGDRFINKRMQMLGSISVGIRLVCDAS